MGAMTSCAQCREGSESKERPENFISYDEYKATKDEKKWVPLDFSVAQVENPEKKKIEASENFKF